MVRIRIHKNERFHVRLVWGKVRTMFSGSHGITTKLERQLQYGYNKMGNAQKVLKLSMGCNFCIVQIRCVLLSCVGIPSLPFFFRKTVQALPVFPNTKTKTFICEIRREKKKTMQQLSQQGLPDNAIRGRSSINSHGRYANTRENAIARQDQIFDWRTAVGQVVFRCTPIGTSRTI